MLGVLGGSWGVLGGSLKGPGAILGDLGGSRKGLGELWGDLGGYWRGLGVILGLVRSARELHESPKGAQGSPKRLDHKPVLAWEREAR